MKHENGYWIDDNGNRWSDRISESEAKAKSDSLIDCRDCINCNNCINCSGCGICVYCVNCVNCVSSVNCDSCSNCRGCVYCVNCVNCGGCTNCRSCRDCHICIDCSNCVDYTINPRQYVTDSIGSRNSQTTFYYGETNNGKSLQVICGCFHGDLDDFEKAVMEKHRDNDVYRDQYLKEIRKVKALFELEEEK